MNRIRKPTLVLVRHGETEGQSSIRYHGRTDVPLSELGRAQMRAARAEILKRHGSVDFNRVFTSPLIRASEGARLIAGDAAQLATIEDFAEVHFGIFEGLTADEIRERHPDDYVKWNADRLASSYTYPGGENRAEFIERVGRGVEQMLRLWSPAADAESKALIVAHRGVVRTIVHRLTDHQPTVELGSIHVLEFEDSWRPALLDHIDHLKDL
jgi:broad specificity phosphatase PhoE